MAPAALPILTAEPGLVHYLEEIRRFPMLERQEEYMLARRWRERGDCDAAHTLVTSHLRLVAKIARDYRGYGLPISEAISEGNVGLVRIATAEAVIMENPGEPWAYKEIGLSTLYLGRPEQALEWFAKAERIGPRDPGRWTWLDGRGHALILLGRDEAAIRSLISGLDANPRNASSRAFLAAAYALLGRSDEARAALDAYDQERPGTRISRFRRFAPVPLALTSPAYQQQRARLNEGLRKAGMPE
jgi:tetratricopeptide (TPR) repeat protein